MQRYLRMNVMGFAGAAIAGVLLLTGCGGGSVDPATAKPVLTPPGGTYAVSQQVTVGDTTSGAVLYCTVDGSAPTSSSPQCSEPMTVTKSETLSAIAIAPGMQPSSVATGSYHINETPAPAPLFSPAPGSYAAMQTVTMSDSLSGAAIYYTTDGSTPTTTSTLYSEPITVSNSETISAIATASGYSPSGVAIASYIITLPTAAPSFSEPSGTYTSAQTVTLTDGTTNAVIYYTTDGTQPTTSSNRYNGGITVAQTETIEAIALAPNYSVSSVAAATYTIAPAAVAAPTFSPAPGIYSSAQMVTISDTTSGATIYYTTDDTAATLSSTVYTAPISVSQTETINAIAAAAGYPNSADAQAIYSISSGPTLSGAVFSGSLAIAGATIQLFGAGTTGYGSGATPLTVPAGGVTTDASGHFTISYTCPAAPADQVYVVATGGASGTNKANSSIGLLAALGSCNGKNFPATVSVNEVTTVASVYALAGFSTLNSGGGITVGAPAPGVSCTSGGITTTGGASCNYVGLANAFRTVGNLVNVTGAVDAYGTPAGAARTITPFYSGADPRNPTGWSSTYGDKSGVNQVNSTDNTVPAPGLNTSTVPQARINALADMLASCVDSDGSGCGSGLFSAATATGGTTPADTLQAALNIARNPGSGGVSVTTLLGLVPTSNPPYPTVLSASAPPTDLTLAITITGAGLGIDQSIDFDDAISNYALAVDVSGNVWVAASPWGGAGIWNGQGMIAGFDSIGEALTLPTSTPRGAVYQDPDTDFSTFGGYGPDLLGPLFGGKLAGQFELPNVFAIDPSGNLWVSDGGLSAGGSGAYQGAELAISSSAAPGKSSVLSPVQWGIAANDTSMAIDGSGNVWFTLYYGGGIYGNSSDLSNLYGPYTLGNSNYQCGISIDSPGLLWATDCGESFDAYAVNAASGNAVATYGGVGGGDYGYGGGNAGYLAAGSNGNLYACNSDQTGYVVLSPSTNSTAPVSSFKTSNGRCGSYLTVDGAGNLWSFASYGISPNGSYVLDEVNPVGGGTQITPNGGYSGTSPAEITATGLTTINGSIGIPGGIAIDASGNLWFLNAGINNADGTSPGNALVEFVGVAAPIVTPTSVAVQNTAQGTEP